MAQEQFNDSYCAILRLLDQTFNGHPETLRTAIGAMYRLKVQAQALMEMPTGDGITTAGPTFDYVPHGEDNLSEGGQFARSAQTSASET